MRQAERRSALGSKIDNPRDAIGKTAVLEASAELGSRVSRQTSLGTSRQNRQRGPASHELVVDPLGRRYLAHEPHACYGCGNHSDSHNTMNRNSSR